MSFVATRAEFADTLFVGLSQDSRLLLSGSHSGSSFVVKRMI
jgi:hypothetical protein